MAKNVFRGGWGFNIGIAFFLVCIFIISTVVYAAENEPTSEAEAQSDPDQTQEIKDIFNLTIPKSWGHIKDIYKGSTGKDTVIVHIQDAHCNYDAQTNISNILAELVANYGVEIAGIEGAAGRLQPELFSTFPDEEIRAQTADYFVRQGKLSGPEALVIKEGFEYPLELYGIEDPKLYADNFNAYRSSLPFTNEARIFFLNLKTYLSQLKMFLYNPDLLDFDVQRTAFENKKRTLNDYCAFLTSQLEKMQLDKSEYPGFSKLLKAINLETRINFDRAEEERAKLLTELTNVLSEEDIRALLDRGADYKNRYLDASKYLAFVKELALKNEIDFSEYKNLDRYIAYAENYDQINSSNLFFEIGEIEDAIRAKLYTTPEQKKLDLLIKGLETMQRLVSIKMVNQDLVFYQQYADELKTDAYFDFINTQAERFNIKAKIPQDIGYLDVYIPAWVNFYQVAGLRDAAMIDSTLRIMEEKKQKIAVMVTGGFHTRELSRMLQARGISYLVITPRITENMGNRYFDILTGKKTDLDNFVEQMNKEAAEAKEPAQ